MVCFVALDVTDGFAKLVSSGEEGTMAREKGILGSADCWPGFCSWLDPGESDCVYIASSTMGLRSDLAVDVGEIEADERAGADTFSVRLTDFVAEIELLSEEGPRPLRSIAFGLDGGPRGSPQIPQRPLLGPHMSHPQPERSDSFKPSFSTPIDVVVLVAGGGGNGA